MHELAIAQAIVSIATKHADGRQVTKVEVRVGRLRQVAPSTLQSAFGLVALDTPAEGAELELSQVTAEGRCRDCGAESALHGFPLACAPCGNPDPEVIAGQELSVEALEFHAEEPASRPLRNRRRAALVR